MRALNTQQNREIVYTYIYTQI